MEEFDATIETSTQRSARRPPSRSSLQPNSLTLNHVFQIVTACGMFFACMKYSPLLAIFLTIALTPAIIRTAVFSQRYREAGKVFTIPMRVGAFISSLLITALTAVVGFAFFMLVSVCFGLFCVLIIFSTGTGTDLLADVGFIGTLGGTIWGIAAAMVSIAWTHQLWRIQLEPHGSATS